MARGSLYSLPKGTDCLKRYSIHTLIKYTIYIAITVVLAFIIISLMPSQTVTYEAEPLKENTYNQELESWIEKLVHAESGGRADIKIIDSNNRYSYGCLQFQSDTFVHYSNEHLVFGSIYDCEVQKKLAISMIKADHSNWQHWYNSVQKIGYPPKI